MGSLLTLTVLGSVTSAVGAVAGTAAGIVGGIQSYEQQKTNAEAQQNMMRYNARMEQREADAELAEANEAARRQREEDARLRAAQRAAYGKSGAAMTSGSPLAVLGDTAANQELGIQDIHRTGARAYSRRTAQAQNYLYQGRVAGNSVSRGQLIGSLGGSIAGGLSGVGGAISGGTSSYVGIKTAQKNGII